MKIKTGNLTGASLDWAVAEAMKPYVKHPERFGIATFGPLFGKGYRYSCWGTRKYSPSTDWKEGGLIIERERINLEPFRDINGDQWCADGEWNSPTPLIAAMRCFVASKLGDEVDVPEELLS